MNPKISIIIPVFNGSNYLDKAIQSALDQDYTNFEVLVINDGSHDQGKTEQIAKSFGNKIRYFTKSNGGVASALNLGIKNMRGSYFSWLSHDDIYFPNKISSQMEFIRDNQLQNTVVYSNYEYIDKKGNNLKDQDQNIQFDESVPFRIGLTLGRISLHGCTLLIPKKCFDYCGLFDENLKTTQDYDLWFRIAKKYQFILYDKVLVKSRLHALQGTTAMKEYVYEEGNQLYKKFIDTVSKSEIEISQIDLPNFYYEFWHRMASIGYLKTIRHLETKIMSTKYDGGISEKARVFSLLFLMVIARTAAEIKRKLLSKIL